MSKIEERDDNFDHLIYMRVYEGCNLHCKHCFIPSNPKKMSIDVVKDIKNHIPKFAKKGDTLLFQWHGGEPTAIGYRFMREALEIINSDLGTDYKIKHGIQTNLINYNEKWKEIFEKYFNSNIGVSWDPEIRLMREGDDASHTEYNEKFWGNVKQAVSDGLELYMVTTATKLFFQTFTNPFDFYNMLINNNIKKLHIEKLTKTGYAIENWNEIGLSYKEHSLSMAKFFKTYLAIKNSDSNLFVSPFDGYLESAQSLNSDAPKGYGCNSGKCDTAFHTVDSLGYRAGCTALTTNEQSKSSGTVDFSGILKMRMGKTRSCFDCKYRTICNSGCATEVTNDDSGECSGGYILYETAENIIKKQLLR